MSYKQNKIMREVLQMQSDGSDKYLINGIDQKLAVYFYRTAQEQFKILSPGDYKIVTELNNTYLTITNAIVSSTAETYQVCYDYIITSSAYTPIGDVDDIILKDKYNQLQADFQTIYEYIRKQGMFSDDTTLDVIFPQLDTGEVFVKTDDGWKGFNIGDIEKNIGDFWLQFNATTKATIDHIENTKVTAEKDITDTVTQGKLDLTNGQKEYYTYLDDVLRRLQLIDNSFRYFSGNNVQERNDQTLLYELNGGNIADRTATTKPARVISGGNVADRQEPQINVDLGKVGG